MMHELMWRSRKKGAVYASKESAAVWTWLAPAFKNMRAENGFCVKDLRKKNKSPPFDMFDKFRHMLDIL